MNRFMPPSPLSPNAPVHLCDSTIRQVCPIRGPEDPLPSVFPRDINSEEFLVLLRSILESGLTDTTVEQSLEHRISELTARQHTLVVSNCTSALHTALWALGIGKGDEVLCPALSDYSTLFAILACGATPVFVDVDEHSGNVSASTIRPRLSCRTRAIIVVHFWGITCDLAPILELSEREGVLVIEDCCQAPLATYQGRRTGSYGLVSVFSTAKEKHWAADSGGILVTDDQSVAARARRFAITRGSHRTAGFGRIHSELGFNYRPSSLSTALMMAQLRSLESLLDRHRAIVNALDRLLIDIPGLRLPSVPIGGDHVGWLYHFRLEEACFPDLAEVVGVVATLGLTAIDTAFYYYLPEACADLLPGVPPLVCPNARNYIRRTLRWPVTTHYSDRDIADIARIVDTGLEVCRRRSTT